MKHRTVKTMGMELDRWEHESCVAFFGVGDDWATLYIIESKIRNEGHATKLLIEAKKYYESQGKKVGGDVALNNTMKHVYEKVGYIEYT